METQGTVHIVDTTNREGVFTSRLCLSPLQKTMINLQLNELGVCESEIGLPATQHQTSYINGNCRLQEIEILKPIRLRGWVPALRTEVAEATERTRLKHLYLSVPSQERVVSSRLGQDWTPERVASEACYAVELAKKAGVETVVLGTQDSSRTSDASLLATAKKARDAGASRYRYCDTWGFENPWSIRPRIEMLARELKMPIEVHCHDDLGLAVANAMAAALGALDAGVDCYVTTTVNGVGERVGLTDLVTFILAMTKSKELRGRKVMGHAVDLSKAWKLAHYAARALNHPISARQVGVGCEAVATTLGMHVDGLARESQENEVYDVEELGRTGADTMELGRWTASGIYDGIRGFRNIYGKLEIAFKDQAEANLVMDLVRMANLENKLPLTGDEIRFITRHPDIAKEIMTMSL